MYQIREREGKQWICPNVQFEYFTQLSSLKFLIFSSRRFYLKLTSWSEVGLFTSIPPSVVAEKRVWGSLAPRRCMGELQTGQEARLSSRVPFSMDMWIQIVPWLMLARSYATLWLWMLYKNVRWQWAQFALHNPFIEFNGVCKKSVLINSLVDIVSIDEKDLESRMLICSSLTSFFHSLFFLGPNYFLTI